MRQCVHRPLFLFFDYRTALTALIVNRSGHETGLTRKKLQRPKTLLKMNPAHHLLHRNRLGRQLRLGQLVAGLGTFGCG